MSVRPLHVLFDASGAVSFREALRKLGRADGVVCFHDHFEFGPINPPDPKGRAQWVDNELGVPNWTDIAAQTESAMAQCAADDVQLSAWISRRDAHWYCGFLEWLSRLGDVPCGMVDLTDLIVPGHLRDGRRSPPSLVIGPSQLSPDQIIEAGL